jgi:hypothetical protein
MNSHATCLIAENLARLAAVAVLANHAPRISEVSASKRISWGERPATFGACLIADADLLAERAMPAAPPMP